MTFEEQLNQLTKIQIEIADLDELNVEWYTNLAEWQNCIWSWVSKREPYKTRENIPTIKASVLEFDETSLKLFKAGGGKPTYHYLSLEKLKYYLDNNEYTHVFIYTIGELDKDQIADLKKWLTSKLI